MAAIPYLNGNRVCIQRVWKEIESTENDIAVTTEPENSQPNKRVSKTRRYICVSTAPTSLR